MEQQQGSARETHSAKGQAQKSATILHYTDMSRHFITRERCEIVYLCLFLTIYYITLQRASYRPLCSPWSGTSHPSNSRRLECLRLKPTLSLLIIFYHHYKYKIQPGGMRVLSPHASKLFGALRHEVFHSGPDQIQCWTQHHQRMGRHWFRPQCNRSLPSSSAKSNWPLCWNLWSRWNSQMQCEGTKRKCESVWMIFVFDRANILTGIAFTRQQQYSNTPDPFAKETHQKTLQPRQSWGSGFGHSSTSTIESRAQRTTKGEWWSTMEKLCTCTVLLNITCHMKNMRKQVSQSYLKNLIPIDSEK